MKTSEFACVLIFVGILAFVLGVAVADANAYCEDIDEDIMTAVNGASERYDIPAELILAVIETESSFRPDAENDGCIGLMQIQKDKLPWLESEYDRKLDLRDIEDNVYAGAYILAGYYHKYDIHYALMCYNGGVGYARKMARKGYESSKYSRKVVNRYENWIVRCGRAQLSESAADEAVSVA